MLLQKVCWLKRELVKWFLLYEAFTVLILPNFSNLVHLLSNIHVKKKKLTAGTEEVHSIAHKRRSLLNKNNVGTYDLFWCNVSRHMTTTHAAYRITSQFMQRIRHCIAVESDFSKYYNWTVEPTSTHVDLQGKPINPHKSNLIWMTEVFCLGAIIIFSSSDWPSAK